MTEARAHGDCVEQHFDLLNQDMEARKGPGLAQGRVRARLERASLPAMTPVARKALGVGVAGTPLPRSASVSEPQGPTLYLGQTQGSASLASFSAQSSGIPAVESPHGSQSSGPALSGGRWWGARLLPCIRIPSPPTGESQPPRGLLPLKAWLTQHTYQQRVPSEWDRVVSCPG